jgi:hypothetical protein
MKYQVQYKVSLERLIELQDLIRDSFELKQVQPDIALYYGTPWHREEI